VLGQCAALTHLDLSDNVIEDAGAASLAEVPGMCAALAHLNLSQNEIEDAGAERLAGVMGHAQRWLTLIQLE
jgi:Ran GTPase-activating protein (RanGAP) involved in mRNA processing and transport